MKQKWPVWSCNLGETVYDIQTAEMKTSSATTVHVLGERNYYCFQGNGVLWFMKRLQYTPCCFHPYILGKYFLLAQEKKKELYFPFPISAKIISLDVLALLNHVYPCNLLSMYDEIKKKYIFTNHKYLYIYIVINLTFIILSS